MANRAKYPSQNLASVGREYIELKLRLGGASAPTVLAGSSALATSGAVAHVGGTNVVTITMRDTWPEVIAHSIDVRDDAGNGAYATLGSFTGEASSTQQVVTFKLQTFNAGGTALNDSTLVVGIVLAMRNSSSTYGNNP